MKKSMKYLAFLLVMVIVCTNIFFALAASIQASPTFNTKSAGLSSSMNGSMSCSTSIICSKIYVSAVKLERKSGSDWVFDQNLPCPSDVVKDNASFGASKSYSSYCTKGNTYRIVVTFNADGVTAQATSGGTAYQ